MIEIVFEPERSRSAAYDDGKEIGECVFSPSDTVWIISHTFVTDEYGGQGIAAKLVEKVVEEARNKGMKIIPLCSFAKREFQEKPEYQDVLRK
ncbi:MAG: GNAT family N-acetyltransferase [Eubacterium sp.]|jgi:predicted GNAT family acetyltransferase